jgi:hypothetical protein
VMSCLRILDQFFNFVDTYEEETCSCNLILVGCDQNPTALLLARLAGAPQLTSKCSK